MTGSGTSLNPYIISTLSDLNSIENNSTAYYELGADIDCEGVINTFQSCWFRGRLDGKGHKIYNVSVIKNRPCGLCSSIYASSNDVEIKNLFINISSAFTSTNSSSSVSFGGITSMAVVSGYKLTIDKCFVTYPSSVTRSNPIAAVGTGSYASVVFGGLIGRATANPSNSANQIIISNSGVYNFHAKASSTYSPASANSLSSCGGLVGGQYYGAAASSGKSYSNENITIKNCYAQGSVSGSGVSSIAYNYNMIDAYMGNTSYSQGTDTLATYVGNYYTTDGTAAKSSTSINKMGVKVLTANMGDESSYPLLDFTNNWEISDGHPVPKYASAGNESTVNVDSYATTAYGSTETEKEKHESTNTTGKTAYASVSIARKVVGKVTSTVKKVVAIVEVGAKTKRSTQSVVGKATSTVSTSNRTSAVREVDSTAQPIYTVINEKRIAKIENISTVKKAVVSTITKKLTGRNVNSYANRGQCYVDAEGVNTFVRTSYSRVRKITSSAYTLLPNEFTAKTSCTISNDGSVSCLVSKQNNVVADVSLCNQVHVTVSV